MGQIILGKNDGSGAKGVGLDDVGPGVQVTPVDGLNHIWTGKNQVFVTAFVLCAAKIVRAEIEGLDCRAHCAVNHEDAFTQGGFQVFDAFH